MVGWKDGCGRQENSIASRNTDEFYNHNTRTRHDRGSDATAAAAAAAAAARGSTEQQSAYDELYGLRKMTSRLLPLSVARHAVYQISGRTERVYIGRDRKWKTSRQRDAMNEVERSLRGFYVNGRVESVDALMK